MGTVTAGQISVGDEVLLLPSQADNQVKQMLESTRSSPLPNEERW